ncbi:MAG: helix-turn-helix domain-containing protein [Paludibacteraceae bacterium]|nr:helix-turn-helix domain-containing protein [Paludibacteraceae bacterium]
MPNIELLKTKIDESGIKHIAIATKCGVNRATLYNKLKGKGEFTTSEIVNLSKVLNLSKQETFEIFLS